MIEKLGITPGPWTQGKDEISNIELDYGIVETGKYDDDRGESEATLRLIAAAPEMLEALIKCAIADDEVNTKLFSYKEGYKLLNPFVEIIEKATGRTWEEVKQLLEVEGWVI